MVIPFSIDDPTKASWYISVTTDANCICTVTAILPPSPPTDVPLDTLRRGEWQGVTRDKRPQLSGQNKTDLMPNNASCKRWDTLVTSPRAVSRLTWALAPRVSNDLLTSPKSRCIF